MHDSIVRVSHVLVSKRERLLVLPGLRLVRYCFEHAVNIHVRGLLCLLVSQGEENVDFSSYNFITIRLAQLEESLNIYGCVHATVTFQEHKKRISSFRYMRVNAIVNSSTPRWIFCRSCRGFTSRPCWRSSFSRWYCKYRDWTSTATLSWPYSWAGRYMACCQRCIGPSRWAALITRSLECSFRGW